MTTKKDAMHRALRNAVPKDDLKSAEMLLPAQ
jgi:hypothetical protein